LLSLYLYGCWRQVLFCPSLAPDQILSVGPTVLDRASAFPLR
jgi:hypothetical protein